MRFEEYSTRYSNIAMHREDGILEVRLHTNEDSFQWGLKAQAELLSAFREISADTENRLVILTGTGIDFSGPRTDPNNSVYAQAGMTPTAATLYQTHRNARQLYAAILSIEVPMIAAINGPVKRHGELALMCDIVIGARQMTLEDTAHFDLGSHVPGDGINIILTLLMGLNRARYMMLMGQVLSSQQCLEIGLVSELVDSTQLQARAWEIARTLAKKPDLLLRYTRITLMHPLKKLIDEGLGYFLSMEALTTIDANH